MQQWRSGTREVFGMGWAFVTLNLPLSIVYLYHPESRQWSLMAVLAMPGLVLPALCAMTRLYRQQAGVGLLGSVCLLGAVLAALGQHAMMMALAHVGIYLGDNTGFTRLPVALQTDLNFWKKHFAEQPGYWLPPMKDISDLVMLFGMVALVTTGWLMFTRQRVTRDATGS